MHVLQISGNAIEDANPTDSIDPWLPSAGVPGYTHRYRATKTGKNIGDTLTGVTNEINTKVLAATGTPKLVTVGGKSALDTATGTGPGFKNDTEGLTGGTLAVVMHVKGTASSDAIAIIAGRQLRVNSGNWILQASGGTPTNLITVTHAVVPRVETATYVLIAALTNGGTADTITVKSSTGTTGATTGPVTVGTGTPYQFGLGKAAGGGSATEGALIHEALVWPTTLTAAEQTTVADTLLANWA